MGVGEGNERMNGMMNEEMSEEGHRVKPFKVRPVKDLGDPSRASGSTSTTTTTG